MKAIARRVRSRSPFRRRKTAETLIEETRQKEADFLQSELERRNLNSSGETAMRGRQQHRAPSEHEENGSYRSGHTKSTTTTARTRQQSGGGLRFRSRSPFRRKKKASELIGEIRQVEVAFYNEKTQQQKQQQESLDKTSDTSFTSAGAAAVADTSFDNSFEYSFPDNNEFTQFATNHFSSADSVEPTAIELVLESPVASPQQARTSFFGSKSSKSEAKGKKQSVVSNTRTSIRSLSPSGKQRGLFQLKRPTCQHEESDTTDTANVPSTPTKSNANSNSSTSRTERSSPSSPSTRKSNSPSKPAESSSSKSFLSTPTTRATAFTRSPSPHRDEFEHALHEDVLNRSRGNSLIRGKKEQVTAPLSMNDSVAQKRKSFRDRFIKSARATKQQQQKNEQQPHNQQQQKHQLHNDDEEEEKEHDLVPERKVNQNASLRRPRLLFKKTLPNKSLMDMDLDIETPEHLDNEQQLPVFDNGKKGHDAAGSTSTPETIDLARRIESHISALSISDPLDNNAGRSVGNASVVAIRETLQRVEQELTTKQGASREMVLRALQALADSLETEEGRLNMKRQLSSLQEESDQSSRGWGDGFDNYRSSPFFHRKRMAEQDRRQRRNEDEEEYSTEDADITFDTEPDESLETSFDTDFGRSMESSSFHQWVDELEQEKTPPAKEKGFLDYLSSLLSDDPYSEEEISSSDSSGLKGPRWLPRPKTRNYNDYRKERYEMERWRRFEQERMRQREKERIDIRRRREEDDRRKGRNGNSHSKSRDRRYIRHNDDTVRRTSHRSEYYDDDSNVLKMSKSREERERRSRRVDEILTSELDDEKNQNGYRRGKYTNDLRPRNKYSFDGQDVLESVSPIADDSLLSSSTRGEDSIFHSPVEMNRQHSLWRRHKNSPGMSAQKEKDLSSSMPERKAAVPPRPVSPMEMELVSVASIESSQFGRRARLHGQPSMADSEMQIIPSIPEERRSRSISRSRQQRGRSRSRKTQQV